jgi:hypothetical protein
MDVASAAIRNYSDYSDVYRRNADNSSEMSRSDPYQCILYGVDDYVFNMETANFTYVDNTTLKKSQEPNVALLSFILFFGTFAIAFVLKKLRRSTFFGGYVSMETSRLLEIQLLVEIFSILQIRRTVSDVGILISIITMVVLDYFIEMKTGIKLEVPSSSLLS